MRKLIYYVLMFIAFTIASQAYGQQDTTNQITSPLLGDTRTSDKDEINTRKDYDKDIYKRIKQLYRDQQECLRLSTGRCTTGPTDCTEPTCEERCFPKILCCHRIEQQDFNDMTRNGTEGHADFPLWQIKTVVDRADCSRERILLSILRRTYAINNVSLTYVTRRSWKSYYSVALMTEVLKIPNIEYVTMYRSIELADGRKIVPFAVHITGEPEPQYYDLSDSEETAP
jgi:hypothetical protein